MKALVVFDSAYGNTAKVAQAMGHALQDNYRTTLMTVDEVEGSAMSMFMDDVDLLVVGSPTQGGRATARMQEFIKNLPPLKGKEVAVFDTRFAEKEHGMGLRLVMKAFGFAAGKMAAVLITKGGNVIAEPVGFIVEDKSGPLKEGELERAEEWARDLAGSQVTLTAS